MTAPIGDKGYEGKAKAELWLSSQSELTKWSSATHNDRLELKAQVARDLSKETGIPEEECSEFVKQWARSSNDDDMRSLAIQKDAAEEFGLEVSEFTQGKIDRNIEMRESFSITDATTGKVTYLVNYTPLQDSPTQCSLLRAMYDKTQSELKARGITEVRAYRGTGLKNELEDWGAIRISTNVLSSWSLSRNTANSFAFSSSKADIQGIVFTVVIPTSRILSLPTN